MMLAPSSAGPAWDGWIAPDNLISLVRNTAPFLFAEPNVARKKRLYDFLDDDGGAIADMHSGGVEAPRKLELAPPCFSYPLNQEPV